MSPTRRALLGAIGSLAAGAALDACTGGHGPSRTIGAAVASSTTTSTTSTTISALPPAQGVDILVLQTASSIEHYAAGVYTRLAGSGLVTAPGFADAMRLFADHHSGHGSMFEGATGRAGGRPFTKANPALSATVQARVDALRTEADVLALLSSIEQLAAGTYTEAATQVSPGLAGLFVAVAATEARHLTVLATAIGGVLAAPGSTTPPYPAGGFFEPSATLTPGVGIA